MYDDKNKRIGSLMAEYHRNESVKTAEEILEKSLEGMFNSRSEKSKYTLKEKEKRSLCFISFRV